MPDNALNRERTNSFALLRFATMWMCISTGLVVSGMLLANALAAFTSGVAPDFSAWASQRAFWIALFAVSAATLFVFANGYLTLWFLLSRKQVGTDQRPLAAKASVK